MIQIEEEDYDLNNGAERTLNNTRKESPLIREAKQPFLDSCHTPMSNRSQRSHRKITTTVRKK